MCSIVLPILFGDLPSRTTTNFANAKILPIMLIWELRSETLSWLVQMESIHMEWLRDLARKWRSASCKFEVIFIRLLLLQMIVFPSAEFG